MDLKAIYQSYKSAMVRITVVTPEGDLSSGAAFHIGDGWLVTAAHVLKDGELHEIISQNLRKSLSIKKLFTMKIQKLI